MKKDVKPRGRSTEKRGLRISVPGVGEQTDLNCWVEGSRTSEQQSAHTFVYLLTNKIFFTFVMMCSIYTFGGRAVEFFWELISAEEIKKK